MSQSKKLKRTYQVSKSDDIIVKQSARRNKVSQAEMIRFAISLLRKPENQYALRSE